jgi:SAM-dependent methyltransferase
MQALARCPFCAGDIRPYWPSVSFSRCVACGLLARNPVPSDAELADLYERGWNDPHSYRDHGGGTTPAHALGRRDLRGMRILEFGAGRGTLSGAVAALGAEVHAIEPFGYHELQARDIPAYRWLGEVPPDLTFDGVLAVDVVEHLREPWRELSALRERLGKGGWLYVSTANTHGLNAMLRRARWREAAKPEHLVFFSPRLFAAVLRQCGYIRCRRLRWRVRYSDKPLRRVFHSATQTLGLDGELRYLAYTG